MESASKDEINIFLKKYRRRMHKPGNFKFIPRKFDFTMMGLNLEQARSEIATLKYRHYDRGPSFDHNGDGTEIWEFGKPIDGQIAYIKLKISQDDFCKCLSFKPSEGPFTLPYRNW